MEPTITEQEEIEQEYMRMIFSGRVISLGGSLIKYFKKNAQKIAELRDNYQKKGKKLNLVQATECFLEGRDPLKETIDGKLEIMLQVEELQRQTGGDEALVVKLSGKVSSYFRPKFIKLAEYVLEKHAQIYEKRFQLILQGRY